MYLRIVDGCIVLYCDIHWINILTNACAEVYTIMAEFYIIEYNHMYIELLMRCQWVKVGSLISAHKKAGLSLPTFRSGCLDLLQGEDEASINTCHYIALHPIKCCHSFEMLMYDIVLHMFMSVVIQEQFCFGGEITDEVISFESLPVNITRKGPACYRASVTLSLSFEGNNVTTFSKLWMAGRKTDRQSWCQWWCDVWAMFCILLLYRFQWGMQFQCFKVG